MCLLATMEDYKLYYLALAKIPGLGPIRSRNLISHVGSIESIFDLSDKEVDALPVLNRDQKRLIKDKTSIDLAEEELHIAQRYGVQIITIDSEAYPYRLRILDDAPLVIYTRGSSNLNPIRSVGIVGTRQASVMGLQSCRDLIEQLAPYCPAIVSGMASGIDGAAHKHALDHDLFSIGIVAHGFKYRYPSSNYRLFDEMEDSGVIVTEYPYSIYASKDNFPRRNRLVAAMSDALVVVESKARGGSLITANIANDINRDVFAIPGRLNDMNFEGCNNLIKNHKAHLLMSAEDIAYVLRWNIDTPTANLKKNLFEDLTTDEKRIINYLRVQSSASFDDLAAHCAIDISVLAATLLQLEFNQLITVMPGSNYSLRA